MAISNLSIPLAIAHFLVGESEMHVLNALLGEETRQIMLIYELTIEICLM